MANIIYNDILPKAQTTLKYGLYELLKLVYVDNGNSYWQTCIIVI